MNSNLIVQKAFGHKLIGNKYMREMVAKTLLHFPENIILEVTKKCWFVSSFSDGWAFALKAEELKKGECMIFLSDELFEQDERQIMYSIAHEIGHVILGHRNSIGEVQTKAEIKKQEREADEFARKFV